MFSTSKFILTIWRFFLFEQFWPRFHIFWLNFDKWNQFSLPLSAVRGNRFLKQCCLREWVISFCLGLDDKKLGVSFEWGGIWVKIPRINAFCRNLSFINSKCSPHMMECKIWEKIQPAFRREIKHYGVYRNMKGVSLRLVLKNKDGNQDCLPFCWF